MTNAPQAKRTTNSVAQVGRHYWRLVLDESQPVQKSVVPEGL
jgi:hypothetical protein